MVQVKADVAAEDAPPPPYLGNGNGEGSSTSQPPPPPPLVRAPPPIITASNLLDISRTHNRVKGAYLIDPALPVPESLLAPRPEDAEGPRPNLRLASTHASVDADVWVVDSPPDHKGPTLLVFDSQYGSVDVRLHTLGNRPCNVEIRAAYGRVNIQIPRDFVGVVSASTTYGSIVVPPQLTTMSEAEGEGKYFMGDLRLVGPDGWQGTTITVKAPQGRIKFTCGEQTEPAKLKKSKWASWFS
ncbi:hypothetical protein AURDEDRAFT_115856 [Auricularia subglabra TFB-10046 SS5]|nr:hypothetical protein AURDEDRAFT_115856 [Auricularia subglabra TFB-10046 SS5]